MLNIINQVFEISQKSEQFSYEHISRNVNRLMHELEESGYTVVNPLGRAYKETDTDVEASLSQKLRSDSKITKVMKPIIYQQVNGQTQLVQKGIVIVE